MLPLLASSQHTLSFRFSNRDQEPFARHLDMLLKMILDISESVVPVASPSSGCLKRNGNILSITQMKESYILYMKPPTSYVPHRCQILSLTASAISQQHQVVKLSKYQLWEQLARHSFSSGHGLPTDIGDQNSTQLYRRPRLKSNYQYLQR